MDFYSIYDCYFKKNKHALLQIYKKNFRYVLHG